MMRLVQSFCHHSKKALSACTRPGRVPNSWHRTRPWPDRRRSGSRGQRHKDRRRCDGLTYGFGTEGTRPKGVTGWPPGRVSPVGRPCPADATQQRQQEAEVCGTSPPRLRPDRAPQLPWPARFRHSQRRGGQRIARAVDGIEPRTVDSAARDRHDWNRFAGEGGPVPMESCRVVLVEGRLLQPLDGADEEQVLGNGCAVRPDDFDLDVVGTGLRAPCDRDIRTPRASAPNSNRWPPTTGPFAYSLPERSHNGTIRYRARPNQQ